jgi:benzoyl-CoA reductase/2-hydroxyglutaryl-CoA dehydratase subunit BcrC/BadD/HgdB
MAEVEKREETADLKSLLKKISAGAQYREMKSAWEAGRPICVAGAGVPIEILYAMEVQPIYPESHAAIAAGIGKAQEFFDLARERGYSQSICSYTRCGLGVSWVNKCALGPIPEADIFISDVSICCLHVTWWTYLQDHFQKPTFFVDIPATDDPEDPEYIAYYEQQLHEMVEFIEKNTSAVFRMEKLKETVRNSDLAGRYWKKIMGLRKNRPSPASFRNISGEILPLVIALGKKEAADFYQALSYFYEDQVKQGATQAKGQEKYRLIWNGIPIWHHLQIIDYFEMKGANFVWEPYTSMSWGNAFPAGRLDPEKPFRSLAEKYTYVKWNMPLEKRFGFFDRAISEYQVDGVVMFSNRSCRPGSIGQDEMIDMIRQKYALPALIFEGDQADPEGFSMQDAKTRIDGFVEVLEARKK